MSLFPSTRRRTKPDGAWCHACTDATGGYVSKRGQGKRSIFTLLIMHSMGVSPCQIGQCFVLNRLSSTCVHIAKKSAQFLIVLGKFGVSLLQEKGHIAEESAQLCVYLLLTSALCSL